MPNALNIRLGSPRRRPDHGSFDLLCAHFRREVFDGGAEAVGLLIRNVQTVLIDSEKGPARLTESRCSARRALPDRWAARLARAVAQRTGCLVHLSRHDQGSAEWVFCGRAPWPTAASVIQSSTHERLLRERATARQRYVNATVAAKHAGDIDSALERWIDTAMAEVLTLDLSDQDTLAVRSYQMRHYPNLKRK